METRSEPSQSRFTVFAILFSLAALFSLGARWEWIWRLVYAFPSILGLAGVFVAASAVMLLSQPRSADRLALLAAALVVLVLVELPAVPNHRLVLGFVSLAILVAYAREKAAGKSGEDLCEGVWSRFAPAARWTAILVYLFAFLVKLNYGYLDPEHSCAARFYGNVHDALGGWLPENRGIHLAIIWFTLIVEGLLPFLLFWRKTRVLAVLSGLSFHFLLALDPVKLFVNFSAVMTALLVLFLPGEFFSWALETWRRISARRKVSYEAFSKLAVVAFLLLFAMVVVLAEFPSLLRVYTGAVVLFWLFFGGGLIAAVVAFMRSGNWEKAAGERPFLAIQGAQVAVIVLLLLNGLSPWLGLKTRTAFNMYSNLRVEAGYTNHLFLPGSFDLLGHLGDTVTISAVNDPQLHADHVETGLAATYFSLGTAAARNPAFEAIYVRDGRRFHYRGFRGDPEPLERPPWILRKLLIFRPVGDGVEKRCYW